MSGLLVDPPSSTSHKLSCVMLHQNRSPTLLGKGKVVRVPTAGQLKSHSNEDTGAGGGMVGGGVVAAHRTLVIWGWLYEAVQVMLSLACTRIKLRLACV